MKILILVFLLFSLSFSVQGSDDHDHHEEEADAVEHEHKDGDEHADEDEEHEEEGGSAVGPEKGITEKSAQGFRLSPEAIKTFELKFQPLEKETLEVPVNGLVEIKNNQFAYRVRDGWIRKVAVKVLRKNSRSVVMQVSDIKPGDQMIIGGTGFVRTAEMVAEEGVSHGHSH